MTDGASGVEHRSGSRVDAAHRDPKLPPSRVSRSAKSRLNRPRTNARPAGGTNAPFAARGANRRCSGVAHFPARARQLTSEAHGKAGNSSAKRSQVIGSRSVRGRRQRAEPHRRPRRRPSAIVPSSKEARAVTCASCSAGSRWSGSPRASMASTAARRAAACGSTSGATTCTSTAASRGPRRADCAGVPRWLLPPRRRRPRPRRPPARGPCCRLIGAPRWRRPPRRRRCRRRSQPPTGSSASPTATAAATARGRTGAMTARAPSPTRCTAPDCCARRWPRRRSCALGRPAGANGSPCTPTAATRSPSSPVCAWTPPAAGGVDRAGTPSRAPRAGSTWTALAHRAALPERVQGPPPRRSLTTGARLAAAAGG